jgi:calcium-dependent protein kinase
MAMDEKKTGLLDFDQLQNCIVRCGLNYNNEDLNNILKNCKLSSSEKINYTSFIAAAINKKKLLNKNVLWETFKHFDIDESGIITISGVEKALKRTGKMKSTEKIKEMFKEAGYGQNASINFEEFCSLLKRDIEI